MGVGAVISALPVMLSFCMYLSRWTRVHDQYINTALSTEQIGGMHHGLPVNLSQEPTYQTNILVCVSCIESRCSSRSRTESRYTWRLRKRRYALGVQVAHSVHRRECGPVGRHLQCWHQGKDATESRSPLTAESSPAPSPVPT